MEDKKPKEKKEKKYIKRKVLFSTTIGGDRSTSSSKGRTALVTPGDPFLLPHQYNPAKIKEYTTDHDVNLTFGNDLLEVFTPAQGTGQNQRVGNNVMVIGMTMKAVSYVDSPTDNMAMTLLGLVDKSAQTAPAAASLLNGAFDFQERSTASSTITLYHDFGCIAQTRNSVVTPTPENLNQGINGSPGEYIFDLSRHFKEPIHVTFNSTNNFPTKNKFYSIVSKSGTGNVANKLYVKFTFYFCDV